MNSGWELVYCLRLPEPTILHQQFVRMRDHEQQRYREQLCWWFVDANDGTPSAPLHESWVHVERHSAKPFPLHADLIGGLKPLLDVLVCPRLRNSHGLGFIVDDAPQYLLQLTAESLQAKPQQGYSVVCIYRPTTSARRLAA